MPSILMTKTDLQDMAWDDTPEGITIISKDLWDHSRWCVTSRIIFKKEDRYYETFFSRGATEYQDEKPYEYDPDLIECHEVKQVPSVSYVKASE